MRKVWIYKRKNINGWWVGCYESGQRKAKALPTKALAEHYRQIKYTQLNSDFITGIVVAEWPQMIAEYHRDKTVEEITESSLYEISLTLRNFERLTSIISSKQLTQNNIDGFILERGKEVKRTTLNKDIRNIKAFIRWSQQKKYTNGSIKIKLLKEDERPVKSLNEFQIKRLLSLSLPLQIISELKLYVEHLSDEQELLFTDKFKHRKWKEICKKIELPDLKFHDMRKTFASKLAQRGVSTAVTQRLLEHSSPTLTQKIYINVDPVLHQSVNQLPIEQWLPK